MRQALRRLLHAPTFTFTAIITLALGSGAAGAVFSLLNGVVLRPLPWREPEQVGLVWAVQPSGEQTWLSYPELDDLRRQPGELLRVAGLADLRMHFLDDGVGEELQAVAGSFDLFDLLGVGPAFGRTFAESDDRPGSARVVVLSDRFWRSRFGGDRTIVGRSISLNDRSYSVIGVLPPTFSILPPTSVVPSVVDVWLPLEPHVASRDRSVRYLHALARVPGGDGFARARGVLHQFASRVVTGSAAAYPGGRWDFTIEPFASSVLGDARRSLTMLFALVALVLIMACANVANLLLVRGESRRTELMVRTALGATPRALAMELFAEAVILAVLGCGLGLGLAAGVPIVLQTIDASALPRLGDVSLDLRVAGFMAALMVLTTIGFTAAPLLERWRRDGAGGVSGDRSGGLGRRAGRTMGALVVVQTTLATAVLISAVFLGDSLVRLQDVNLGFAITNRIAGRIAVSPRYPTNAAAAEFFTAAVEAAERLPGVVRAAAITQLPLSGALLGSTFVLGPGADAARVDVDLRGVTSGYFDTMGTPLMAGRGFSPSDTAASPPVAIVDETFARKLGGVQQALGQRIRWIRQPEADVEIVGVVSGVHHRSADAAARETVYRPHLQYPRNTMFVVLHTANSAFSASALREAVASVDPTQALADVQTMQARVDRSLSGSRTGVLLALALATLSLTLGLVGLYGVLSFVVSRRMREFAIRLAIGAPPRTVRRLVFQHGLTLVARGVTAGAVGAALIVTAIRGMLFGIDASALKPYAIGIALVVICSLAALALPARRAARAEPQALLRG